MGIDVDRVIVVTFFIGSALAGAAGVFNCLVYQQLWPYMGFQAGLFAFTAAVDRRDRQPSRRGARRTRDRAHVGVRDGLRVVGVPGGDRVRDPDRRHARAAERTARTSGGAKGLMDGGREIPNIPARPDEGEPGIRVGVDDWVATHEQRHEQLPGVARPAPARDRADAAAGVLRARSGSRRRCCPRSRANGYVIRVGFDTVLVHAALPRPERRRRLRGTARPRLRRVLRLRRVHVRDARVAALRPALGHADRRADRRGRDGDLSASSSRCRRGGSSATTSRSSRSSSASCS